MSVRRSGWCRNAGPEAFAESSTRGRKMLGCRSRIALQLGPSQMRWDEHNNIQTQPRSPCRTTGACGRTQRSVTCSGQRSDDIRGHLWCVSSRSEAFNSLPCRGPMTERRTGKPRPSSGMARPRARSWRAATRAGKRTMSCELTYLKLHTLPREGPDRNYSLRNCPLPHALKPDLPRLSR